MISDASHGLMSWPLSCPLNYFANGRLRLRYYIFSTDWNILRGENHSVINCSSTAFHFHWRPTPLGSRIRRGGKGRDFNRGEGRGNILIKNVFGS